MMSAKYYIFGPLNLYLLNFSFVFVFFFFFVSFGVLIFCRLLRYIYG
jgi:hypothetical protein